MVKFIEDTHQYFDGKKELISVTTLMAKHNLGPDYSKVKKEVLDAKANRGTLIHKEIEDFNKNGEIGFTNEMLNFKQYIEKYNIKVLESEKILYNTLVAGTCDLILDEGGELTIADLKTTSTLHKDAVSWQLSIYNYLDDRKCSKAQAFHFDSEGNLKVVTIPFKPKEEIERLMECEALGIPFVPSANLLSFPQEQIKAFDDAQEVILKAELMKKEAEAKITTIREAILKAMEENGVKSFSTNKFRLNYIDATTRTMIDSTKLKKELPEVAEKYSKTTNVKATLRITLKGE